MWLTAGAIFVPCSQVAHVILYPNSDKTLVLIQGNQSKLCSMIFTYFHETFRNGRNLIGDSASHGATSCNGTVRHESWAKMQIAESVDFASESDFW